MQTHIFKRSDHLLLPNFGLIGGFLLVAFGLWLIREPAKIELYVINLGLVLLLINLFWKSRERIIVSEQGLDMYQMPQRTLVGWNEVAYINYTEHDHEPRPYLVVQQANQLVSEQLINQLTNDNHAYRVMYLDRWERSTELLESIKQQLEQQTFDQVRVQFNIQI
ncbi:hypothetical protein [Herpetosiphon geysericola]|uniref:Uncharacterized protein n=1 Tax=Herpetosiphon geysericola TaxID=70996 RepID=A0A0P6XYA5_9CHLR|nr:hypothetical protein [Herpetosiphon geysericola]KPL81161.1 hypothetical protein SE18_20900 [Herpetosiphon geysericola]